MTTKFTEQFFQWAEAHGITREDIAAETGNSKQTVSKWRSIGIPKGKEFGLRSFMQRQLRSDVESIRAKMVLHPTHEQFTRWNKAALHARKTIEDWAFEGLEEMADEYYTTVAAEPKAPYNQKPTQADEADAEKLNGDENAS